jgi:anti-sigma factor (TIGR02949 family)
VKSHDMTCQQFSDFLMEYLDGEVAPEQRTTFEEHLRLCPPCVTYLETYEEAVRIGKACCEDPDGPVPGDVPEALVEAVLRARRSR